MEDLLNAVDEGCLYVYDTFPASSWREKEDERMRGKLERHFSGKGD
jgi:hypothetical protein